MTSGNITEYSDHAFIEREGQGSQFVVGQWYWCKEELSDEKGSIVKKIDGESYFLMCLVHIGSNVLELYEPSSKDMPTRWERILFVDAINRLILEPNYQRIIQGFIDEKSVKTKHLLQQMSARACELGIQVSGDVGSYVALEALPAPATPSEGTGIAILSDVLDVEQYKVDVVEFKEVTLPALQKEVKETCSAMSKWAMSVTLLPSTMIDQMRSDMEKVTDRIEDVSIYAGINESAVLVRDGLSASADEVIHFMQLRRYMDEECLVDYDAGGMSFENIHEFDQWISRSGNMERLFPFPKTVVAFKVRRKTKEYENNLSAFIQFTLEDQDKKTFLYIRNGEKIYRISSSIEFDEMIFPSEKGLFNEPIMVKGYHGRVNDVITVREYEQVKSAIDSLGAKEAAKVCGYNIVSEISGGRYKAFDNSNIFFDEINAHFANKIKKYNKVSIILQGLLDRSEALSPHHKISLSNPRDFMESIRLIYDAENVLYSGDEPDFEAYRKELNSSINSDSVFVGQFEAFVRRETDKENSRRMRSDYRNELVELNRYIPNNNAGPAQISRAKKVMQTGKAVFAWERESLKDWDVMVADSITVPFSELLNASAYKLGDYKRFFADPRTREKYLQWAPYLLKAEDYAAGKS